MSQEAQRLVERLLAWPEPHARVRVVGLAVAYWETYMELDAFVAMPFTVSQLLSVVEQMGAEMRAGE